MIVLAGVDGSERSCAAIAFASQLLRPGDDRFVIYCSPRRVRVSQAEVLADARLQKASDAVAQAIFERTRERVPEPFRDSISTILGDTKPIDGLVSAADAHQAGMIVVGAHGATEKRTLFPGGVARGVAHRANVPVLMVREQVANRRRGPLRVLLAHCRTPACEAAVQFLNQLHWPADTVGLVTHVVETLDPDYVAALERNPGPAALDLPAMLDDYRRHVEEDKATSLATLREVQTQLPEPFRSTEPIIVEGHSVEQIMDVVERESVDLLVVGARSLSVVGRFLSSTSESLMLHCPASILIVHARVRS